MDASRSLLCHLQSVVVLGTDHDLVHLDYFLPRILKQKIYNYIPLETSCLSCAYCCPTSRNLCHRQNHYVVNHNMTLKSCSTNTLRFQNLKILGYFKARLNIKQFHKPKKKNGKAFLPALLILHKFISFQQDLNIRENGLMNGDRQ